MGFWLGRGRKARRCYGFDEIALVPGNVTVNPNEVDPSWEIGGRRFRVPIIASAMDGVVDVNFAVAMSKFGGLAALSAGQGHAQGLLGKHPQAGLTRPG